MCQMIEGKLINCIEFKANEMSPEQIEEMNPRYEELEKRFQELYARDIVSPDDARDG